MRLTQRLLLGSLVVITVFVVFAVAIVDRRVVRRSVEETVASLVREARLLASQARPGMNFDSLARAASLSSGRRVTVIDQTGRIVGDSEISAAAFALVENQRVHADVAAAIDSQRTGRGRYEFGGRQLLHVSAPAPVGAVRLSVPASEPGALSSGIQRDLLLAGFIAMLIALGLATLFARSVSRPVIELRDVARALADGNLSRVPAISAPGEVGELSNAIHRLSEQLATRLAALEAEQALHMALIDSLHEGVIAVDTRRRVVRINNAGRFLLDIKLDPPFSTDLLPRHRALREALADALAGHTTRNIEIEVESRRVALTARPLRGGAVLALFDVTPIRRLEAVRRDFVANVSHELRTPLTIIAGFAETLASSDVPAGKRKEFANLIQSNAARMQRLVDDLLDLSRIESGGWTPKPMVLDAQEAIREVVAQLSEAAQLKGLTIEQSIAPDAPLVFADPTALRQIIFNLLENAIRYTSEGTVTVSVVGDGLGVRIAVQDTGIGIPPEHLPRIFERFYRVDPGRSREKGGTGLGLSIVRHMAEAHGGSVSATSIPGRGTAVSIFLPRESDVQISS